MNIPHRLSLVIQTSHTLAEILDSAVDILAEELEVDVCSIYLVEPNTHRVRLMASHGLAAGAKGKVTLAVGEGLTGTVVKEMRALVVDDASSHPGYRYFPETKEEQFHSYLGVPMALRNRPVGALVIQSQERRLHDKSQVQALTAIASQLVGVVENARLIEALDRGYEGVDYLREVRSWHVGNARLAARERPEDAAEDLELRATAASPGIAIGEAVLRGTDDITLESFDRPVLTHQEEKVLVANAFEETRQEIARIQQEAREQTDEEHALIFSSHLLLLNDRTMHQRIDAAIDDGTPAQVAVFQSMERFRDQLENVSDPYLQERAEDIADVRSRLLSHLLEKSDGRTTTVSEKIVVAQSIRPSVVVELKAEGARAIVTTRGGPTSHGALLARSMGIPAVTGLRHALARIGSGERLVVDGAAGVVIVAPSGKTLSEYEERGRALTAQNEADLRFCHVPARTRDGRRIQLQANISVATDIAMAKENGAEGIGLFRTEFPFLIREEFPTPQEQARNYRRPYEYFPEGPVRFRLLDVGGDKLLPGNTMRADRNPFQGYRSLRLLLDHPNILADQVEAFARAAGTRPLSILIPMVSSLTELRSTCAIIHEIFESVQSGGSLEIGAMIEVPGAVEIADTIAAEVDFLSIGSNDLIQYLLAVDRENENAASVDDPYHPAVLRAIRRIIQAGHEANVTVSLCGEMAGLRPLALALIAMGIDALSVAPGTVPAMKRFLASSRVEPLETELDALLDLGEAHEIRAALEHHLPERILSAPE